MRKMFPLKKHRAGEDAGPIVQFIENAGEGDGPEDTGALESSVGSVHE
jgi:hypothetical protein